MTFPHKGRLTYSFAGACEQLYCSYCQRTVESGRSPLGFAGGAGTVAGNGGLLLFLVLGNDNNMLLRIISVLHYCNYNFISAHSVSSHLALLVQHGQGRQVLAWVESGLGVVLLRHGAVHVVPGVHEGVTKTVVVEVLTLKYQSQSPAEGKVGATD